jgi:alpha-tubulin suppressor-like RCC1 family protein
MGSVTCGAEFACGLGPDGTAYCWGANESGQLGTGSVGLPSIAASAVAGHLFTQLTAGAHHVCGVHADGSVYCWGANESGQLGTGLTKGVAAPTLVAKVSAAPDRPLALGNDFTLALAARAAKNPSGWGSNGFGQLADGSTTSALLPTPVAGIATADLGSAGTLYTGSTAEHACARIGDALECWGANVFGEVGDGTTDDRSAPIVIFDGKTAATQIAPGKHSVAVGGRHTCAITAKGDVMCWGANHRYQLGSSVLTPQRSPVRGY